jgi:signal transduction histidine kinase
VFKEVDINRSIEEVVSLIEHQFKLGGVEIRRNYAKGLPPLYIDEKQMQEVIMNLFNNARDAILEEGIIEVTTGSDDNFIKIEVKDNGKGMSKEVLDKIFDPFFTTKEKGTGLGLSMCYSIVKSYNGKLNFESSPGKGTTATILLPIKTKREG